MVPIIITNPFMLSYMLLFVSVFVLDIHSSFKYISTFLFNPFKDLNNLNVACSKWTELLEL